MNYRGGYGESFGVCDFCDTDSSGSGIKFVDVIGNKGICNKCALALRLAIMKTEIK